MIKKLRFVVTLGLALFAGSANAALIELITNGGFETGDFTGWTVTDQSGGIGSWFIDNADGTTPFSGSATVGPAGGSFYAVTDQSGPGTHVLEQSFTVPVGSTSLMLSFDMFMNDWNSVDPIVNPAGLDYTSYPNQHARVDIMTALASAFSISAADVVANLVAPGGDAGTDPNPYTSYLFDITGFVTAGSTSKLRFAEVDNQFFFNQGVDNVSLVADVPEPATLALFGLGLAGLGFARKKRKSA